MKFSRFTPQAWKFESAFLKTALQNYHPLNQCFLLLISAGCMYICVVLCCHTLCLCRHMYSRYRYLYRVVLLYPIPAQVTTNKHNYVFCTWYRATSSLQLLSIWGGQTSYRGQRLFGFHDLIGVNYRPCSFRASSADQPISRKNLFFTRGDLLK